MTISIGLREDDAIVIYEEDDPRSGVVIVTAADAANLACKLHAAAHRRFGEEQWKRAQLRALMEADDLD